MPAAAPSGSVIKMIQAGTVTVASGGTTGTYTISPTITTLGNAMVVWNGETNNDTSGLDGRTAVTLTLTNTSTVTATRVGTGAFSATIAFTIVEFASGVNSIQQGSISIAPAGTGSNTATISTVGANAFVLYEGMNVSGNTTATWPQGAVTLTNTTTVTAFVQVSATITQSVRYMVVDLDSTIVTSAQHLAVAMTSSNTSDTDTITSVTAANSSLMWGGVVMLAATTGTDAYSTFLTNGTTVTKTRTGLSVVSRTVYYAAVNWASAALNGSVQRTNSALAIAASTSAVWTLGSSVNAAKSFVNYNGFSAANTANVATVMPSLAITGAGATITASINTSGSTTPTAEVVQFQ